MEGERVVAGPKVHHQVGGAAGAAGHGAVDAGVGQAVVGPTGDLTEGVAASAVATDVNEGRTGAGASPQASADRGHGGPRGPGVSGGVVRLHGVEEAAFKVRSDVGPADG